MAKIPNAFYQNSNPIGVGPGTNVVVASVSLTIGGRQEHDVLLIGEFSADVSDATGGIVVGDIQVDGSTHINTQVNNLSGATGTIVVVSGIVSVHPGAHTFDLRAYSTNVSYVGAHHRLLSAVDLG